MSTKFYYYSNTPSNRKVKASSIWGFLTGQADICEMGTGRLNTPTEIKSFFEETNISNAPVLNRIYTSPPIDNYIFSGKVSGQLLCWEGTGHAGFMPRVKIKLCSSSGTDKADIFTIPFPAGPDTGNFFYQEYFYSNPISGQNKLYPPASGVRTVTGLSGDFIAVEVGCICFNNLTDKISGANYFGDSGDELPINSYIITNTGTPWLEFSENIPILHLPPTDTYIPPTGG